MSENSPKNFAEWRSLAFLDPERLVDLFLNQLELVSEETRRAFIAAHHERDLLIENIKRGCSDTSNPLAGIPFVIQDLFDVKELPTRCGSPFQDPFDSPLEEDSSLQQKLTNLGATLIAKTVPSEFGVDPKGQNKSFGDCPHAHGRRYICGGGAGSSAYAVSGGWAPLGFGLDSSGGVRIPAAFHGLFGFRMSSNAYSREGVIAITPSLESVGWMNRNLTDLRKTFAAIYPVAAKASKEIPLGYFFNDPTIRLQPELKLGLMNLVRNFRIDETPCVNKKLCICFRLAAEAYATIESRELYSIHQYWIEEYRDRYDDRLLRRIEAGQICTSDKVETASSIQQSIREMMATLFQKYDYLIMPISTFPTPGKSNWSGQLENDLLRLNAPVSLAALPAIIIPFKCDDRRHSAAQIVVNPHKMHLVPAILDQVKHLYEDE